MRGVVTFPQLDTQAPEVTGFAEIGIAAGNSNASAHEQLGKAAHPRARDADEVNGPRIGGIEERHEREEYGEYWGGAQVTVGPGQRSLALSE